MTDKSFFEKLADMSPGMELWWDASPIIFDEWKRRVLDKAEGEHKALLEKQIARMVNQADPLNQLIKGVTTNPPLSLQVFQWGPERWNKAAREIVEKEKNPDVESLFWLLYKEVVKAGSDMYMPLFEKSGCKLGYISAQVDPRIVHDADRMIEQGEELAKINPNVMIKVPGTKAGYDVIEHLTEKGISTNNTLTFVVSQMTDCAKTVRKALEKAASNGVDLTRYRSIITQMESRYGDLGGLRDHAKEAGLTLTDAEVRLAELAIFKKMHRFLKDGGYVSKLLSCSLRFGPEVDGKTQLWHLQEKTGANIVITLPPKFIEDVLNFDGEFSLEPDRINAGIPAETMDKLMKIPYFARGYDENGHTRDEYNEHPALLGTEKQFSDATWEMVKFAENCLK